MMQSKNIHVVHKHGKWMVEEEGSKSAAEFATREEAVQVGKQNAKNNCVELLIHREDGTIGERDSYGNDPRDIPG